MSSVSKIVKFNTLDRRWQELVKELKCYWLIYQLGLRSIMMYSAPYQGPELDLPERLPLFSHIMTSHCGGLRHGIVTRIDYLSRRIYVTIMHEAPEEISLERFVGSPGPLYVRVYYNRQCLPKEEILSNTKNLGSFKQSPQKLAGSCLLGPDVVQFDRNNELYSRTWVFFITILLLVTWTPRSKLLPLGIVFFFTHEVHLAGYIMKYNIYIPHYRSIRLEWNQESDSRWMPSDFFDIKRSLQILEVGSYVRTRAEHSLIEYHDGMVSRIKGPKNLKTIMIIHKLKESHAIREDSLDNFIGADLWLLEHLGIKLIDSQIKNNIKYQKLHCNYYNLFFENCELFALYCKYGQNRTKIVDQVTYFSLLAALIVGFVLLWVASLINSVYSLNSELFMFESSDNSFGLLTRGVVEGLIYWILYAFGLAATFRVCFPSKIVRETMIPIRVP